MSLLGVKRLMAALNELQRAHEHSVLISRDAKCRVASFLINLSKRTTTQTCLDLPMSHQEIADHLGLTIETLSRVITQMENSGLVARGRSPRDLILSNHRALVHMAK
jgi:CRP/FNR family nitrogen fixation transcriptional regulator